MTSPKIYRTPAGFKVALEDRLKKRAAERRVLVNRVRQRFVMERFLARVVITFGRDATLKGGLAMELRLSNARSTKDVDLRATGEPDAVLARLRAAASLALGDQLVFAVDPDPDHPDIEEAVYDGRRFRVSVTLAGQVYGSPFGVDVGMGDPMHGAPEELVGEDFLDFVGVEPLRIGAYPIETHVAEKLHAYSRPPLRPGRENSRVRDLPDLALLAETQALDARSLRAAIDTTFAFRATHPVPEVVAAPPATWRAPYAALAVEQGLPWKTIDEAHAAVVDFLGPVLAGGHVMWDPRSRRWNAP